MLELYFHFTPKKERLRGKTAPVLLTSGVWNWALEVAGGTKIYAIWPISSFHRIGLVMLNKYSERLSKKPVLRIEVRQTPQWGWSSHQEQFCLFQIKIVVTKQFCKTCCIWWWAGDFVFRFISASSGIQQVAPPIFSLHTDYLLPIISCSYTKLATQTKIAET